MLDYVEEHFGPEYQEAETKFERGLVSREHVSKFFRPNELLVRLEENEPVCYLSKRCPSSLSTPIVLNCQTWVFNGAFQRQEKQITIPWPSVDSKPVPIISLYAYPLRFDPTKTLEKSLRDRGNLFWICRKRKFLGYDAPATSFEIQVVCAILLPTYTGIASFTDNIRRILDI
jgi:hypothetical protein